MPTAATDIEMNEESGPGVAGGPGSVHDSTTPDAFRMNQPVDHHADATRPLEIDLSDLEPELEGSGEVVIHESRDGEETHEKAGNTSASVSGEEGSGNVSRTDTGIIYLRNPTGEATYDIPMAVSNSDDINLVCELDNLTPTYHNNLPLGFDAYALQSSSISHVLNSVSVNPAVSLLNNAPFPDLSRRTEWVQDFSFGPPSEHINIPAFLKGVEESIGLRGSGECGKLSVGDVAGWAELQEMGTDAKRELTDECSVSDLLKVLTDITSDPAHLASLRDFYNQASLATLGHTEETIKLPPEMRDRKRRRGGKVSTEQRGVGSAAGEGGGGSMRREARSETGTVGAATCSPDLTKADDPTLTGPEDTVMAESELETSKSPEITAGSESTSRLRESGKNRKVKDRTEAEERSPAPNHMLPQSANTLDRISLQSWALPETAKHFIRKPRSSDVNVLTELRPSHIPFVLSEQVSDNTPLATTTAGVTGAEGPVISDHPTGYGHAMIELSILTPAPHPPHTPRHTMSLALLDTQTLEDISEALICANRWIPRSMDGGGGIISGACAVIEGMVYGDGDGDTDGRDYAEKLVHYLSTLKSQNALVNLSKRDKDAILVLNEQLKIGLPMLSTRLDSVQWRLHKPYWYMHDGGCVHWIVVSSISLLHEYDPPLPTPEKPSNWPYVTSLSPLPHRALCRVCARVPAILAVSGDTRLGENPSLVCEGCWALLGPPKAGRDCSEQAGDRLNILPLVSPDGL